MGISFLAAFIYYYYLLFFLCGEKLSDVPLKLY